VEVGKGKEERNYTRKRGSGRELKERKRVKNERT
jgi:hypothetical protein